MKRAPRRKAVFLDRDGVLNDLVYDKEEGRVSGPFSAKQMHVFAYTPEAIKRIKDVGFMAIVVSNQPGVAKGQFTLSEFERMRKKLRQTLEEKGVSLDGEYYCLHHPYARLAKYRKTCDCRKPKPGLLLRAAKDNDLDLAGSFIIGDSLVDVEAGRRAGCRTILIGHLTDFLSRTMEEERVTPDYVIGSLKDAPELLTRLVP